MRMIHEMTLLALLRYAILATKPDIVVSQIDETNVRVLAAMHETKAPVVVTDARRVLLKRYARARDALYRRAAAVIAPHPVIADWFKARNANALSIFKSVGFTIRSNPCPKGLPPAHRLAFTIFFRETSRTTVARRAVATQHGRRSHAVL